MKRVFHYPKRLAAVGLGVGLPVVGLAVSILYIAIDAALEPIWHTNQWLAIFIALVAMAVGCIFVVSGWGILFNRMRVELSDYDLLIFDMFRQKRIAITQIEGVTVGEYAVIIHTLDGQRYSIDDAFFQSDAVKEAVVARLRTRAP